MSLSRVPGPKPGAFTSFATQATSRPRVLSPGEKRERRGSVVLDTRAPLGGMQPDGLEVVTAWASAVAPALVLFSCLLHGKGKPCDCQKSLSGIIIEYHRRSLKIMED
jgi:hypothetical protein